MSVTIVEKVTHDDRLPYGRALFPRPTARKSLAEAASLGH